LGVGNCGKTTFLKQMLLANGEGVSGPERLKLVREIRLRIVDAVLKLAKNLDRLTDGMVLSEEMNGCVEILERFDKTAAIDDPMKDALRKLWSNDAIKAAFEKYEVVHIPYSTAYFIEQRLDAVCAGDYCPSDTDLVQSRVKTEKVYQVSFIVDENRFYLVDVGGQRDQRERWNAHFNDAQETFVVNGVVFVAGLDGIDQVIEEDEKTNVMTESLNVFEEAITKDALKDAALVLFLNKTDLFRKKLENGLDFQALYPDFPGGDADAAIEYISGLFQERATKSGERQVYMKPTCVTDPDNCKTVFGAVKSHVNYGNLKGAGFV